MNVSVDLANEMTRESHRTFLTTRSRTLLRNGAAQIMRLAAQIHGLSADKCAGKPASCAEKMRVSETAGD